MWKEKSPITKILIVGILALISVLLSPVLICADSPVISATSGQFDIRVLWGPYLTGTSSAGVTINCRTDLPSSAVVEYATRAYYTAYGSYEGSDTDGLTVTLHHISLTGLQPGTTYHYRLVCEDEVTQDYQFSTFPASGPFTFIVYSDTQDQLPTFSQYERYKLVADRVAAETNIAFVLHCGDAVASGNDITDWDRYFDIGRQLMAGTTVYPALGNHEDNADLYYETFGLPAYYSFDCSSAHFTVLDSDMEFPDQTAWLDSDLDTGKPWKFVSYHHPMYTSDPRHFGGWLNLRAAWEDLLISHGVKAVWNGHCHAYERYLENGINHIVIGTGGAPCYQLSSPKCEGYQNSLENSLGYARVSVDPLAGTARVQFIRVADISSDNSTVTAIYPPGTVYDSFLLTSAIKPPGWDLNGDHACNIGDLVALGWRWGETGPQSWTPEDLNADGVINIGDVTILGLHWGETW
jgi:hypothetical protein